MSKISKLTLEQTDERVPKLAEVATSSAYRRARRVGAVMVYRNGEIRRIKADGDYEVVKKIEPRIRIPKGSKFQLKPDTA